MSSSFIHDEADVAERQIWNYMNNKSQCSIASIVAINSSPVSVNIQPLVNYFDRIAQWQQYPVLEFIPVAQFQTTSYSINTPLNIGDVGIVLWFDREVYTTLLNGASAPGQPDSGNLSDTNACVFIPIIQPFSLANPIKNSGLDIISSNISLMTQLINLLSQTLSLLTNLNTYLSGVASTPSSNGDTYAANVAILCSAFENQISLISTQMNLIKTDLTTFQGAQS